MPYTTYPLRTLGDPPFKATKPRSCLVICWDGDRFASVTLSGGQKVTVPLKYLYTSRSTKHHFVPGLETILSRNLKDYDYPTPALTVDGVLFGLNDDQKLHILLIKRRFDPFRGKWAIPGGFVDDMDESLDDAVRRELEEETSIKNVYLEQLYTFGSPRRDPRRRVVSVSYYGLVKSSGLRPVPRSDASEAEWFEVSELPNVRLAFDHREIVDTALNRLRAKVRYQPIGFELLPRKFTLVQLQRMYEQILGRELDKRNFRRKVMSLEILETLDEKVAATTKPAQLFRFDQRAYDRLVKQGYDFEL